MPKVKVTHPNIAGEDATAPPVRTPIEPGTYEAAIVGVALGTTKGEHKLMKMSVSYQVLNKIAEDGKAEKVESGRRVFQDYILEADLNYPDLSDQRRFELRQLLDATGVPFDDDGFDTDHFITEPHKRVRITVKHREGTELDDAGRKRIFTNVTKVDANLDLQAEMAAGDII
jgi:hypothetical protein